MKIRIECNVTQRCNARCDHCNKAVGYSDNLFPDMTLKQMRLAVDLLIEQRIHVTRFTFCGGEPILHQDLQAMVFEVARLPGLRRGRLLTNDMPVTQAKRDAIELPPHFRWVKQPLDDPTDPYSGKNKKDGRANKRYHLPFWISPKDLGIQSTFEECSIRTWCGIGLDALGFSMCGKATMLARLLEQRDVARWDGDIGEHVLTPIHSICDHCQYGCTRSTQHEIYDRHQSGELQAISETFEEAFSRAAKFSSGCELVQIGQ